MGDRTNVTLYILKSQTEKTSKLIDAITHNPNGIQDGKYLICPFEFDEVNYGELEFLPNLLAAGIAYESYWDKGAEYNEGVEYGRFTPLGDINIKTIYNDDKNPYIGKLIELIDDPIKLRNYIINHNNSNTPLSWDNQEEYGQVYRTKQLIIGNSI